MSLFIGVIIGLIILTVLVVIHEAGHAMAALRNGVVVEEFGIGFPPKVWGKKLKNGILFTLNALPIGGFVKLQGENDAATNKGDYGAASFWQKTKILLAGVTVNWLFAAVLLSGLALIGMPKVLDNQFAVASDAHVAYQPVTIASVVDNYPADQAGLKIGDQIISFAGNDVETVDQLVALIKQHAGEKATIVYKRNGVEKMVSTTVKSQTSSNGLLGAGLGQNEYVRSTWSAPIVGVATTAQFTYETFAGLGTLIYDLASGITGQFSSNQSVKSEASQSLSSASKSVAGPIGILGIIFPAAEQAGAIQLIFLAAIISLSLAVMNILPIPALDGGRWLTMAIFKVTKKDLTREREEKIQTVGFALLFLLMIVVTVADVAKII